MLRCQSKHFGAWVSRAFCISIKKKKKKKLKKTGVSEKSNIRSQL